MKQIFTLLVICVSATTFAQKTTEMPLAKTWKLKSHMMIGLGTHTSLPKGTQIEFLRDGTWKSSTPWQSVQQGKWNLKDNKLQVSFGEDDEDVFHVIRLTHEQLQLETHTIVAVYKLAFDVLK